MIRSLVACFVLVCVLGLSVEARAQDNRGFIYGTVITESGTEYRGFMRWGKQEAFWDDLFHSLKDELPYIDEIEDMDLMDEDPDDRRDRRDRGGKIKVFNFRIDWDKDDDWGASRVFVARFGDIERLEITGDEDALVVLRNGDEFDVSGYSDDVGGTIRMRDDSLGEIDLKWDRIESISFEAAPRSADPGMRRLYGTVESDAGDFTGYIMWDKEECTTVDLLDGESEDGDLSIEFGRISAIERRGRSSSIVELRDGRRLRLRGSNDVDDDNRGIMIEDPRFGRVTVEWDAFDRLELTDPNGSGRGYDEYERPRALTGRVEDRDGDVFEGRIVFDLDEAGTWEMLNGSYRDVSFDIPFELVTSVEPVDDDASRIALRSGEEIELEDSQDISERNDGLLVYLDGDDAVYVPWRELRRVEFDAR